MNNSGFTIEQARMQIAKSEEIVAQKCGAHHPVLVEHFKKEMEMTLTLSEKVAGNVSASTGSSVSLTPFLQSVIMEGRNLLLRDLSKTRADLDEKPIDFLLKNNKSGKQYSQKELNRAAGSPSLQ